MTPSSEVRVRFAPSPTGYLHVGGARTAIYNWAFARKHGGTFILRIEDTDPERSTPENTEQIMRSLRWLGLDWDEGPLVGGDSGPYLQTERFQLYADWLARLVERDGAYACFCTAEELAARREKAQTDQSADAYSYDRRCRDIEPAEAARRVQSGQAHTWRLKLPLERGPVVFDDAVHGRISIPYQQLDDFILVRSDGTPTYNYAAVIDDITMHISHVIRGDDHLSNTPKQIMIYEALGEPAPIFAHLSMILGADGSRLSKRHGAVSVEAYGDAGYLSEALLNYLALLGWSLDGETTLLDAETLKANFSLERVSRNPAVFDLAKLDWINAAYIKQMGASAFVDAWSSRLAEAGHTVTADNRGWYEAIYPLIAERVKTLNDALPMTAYLFSGPQVELDQASVDKCLLQEGTADILTATIDLLKNAALPWQHAELESALRALTEQLEIKPKVLFQAIRVAICGNIVSPPLFESMALLGRENSLARLQSALLLAL